MNLRTRFDYVPNGSLPLYGGCGENSAIFLSEDGDKILTNKSPYIFFNFQEYFGPNLQSLVMKMIESIGPLVDEYPWEANDCVLFIPHRGLQWYSNRIKPFMCSFIAGPALIKPEICDFFEDRDKSIVGFPMPERFNYYNLQDEFMIWDILT